MSWRDAVRHALAWALVTGRHYYVHGYRKTDGSWRYGFYREYRPNLQGRIWP